MNTETKEAVKAFAKYLDDARDGMTGLWKDTSIWGKEGAVQTIAERYLTALSEPASGEDKRCQFCNTYTANGNYKGKPICSECATYKPYPYGHPTPSEPQPEDGEDRKKNGSHEDWKRAYEVATKLFNLRSVQLSEYAKEITDLKQQLETTNVEYKTLYEELLSKCETLEQQLEQKDREIAYHAENVARFRKNCSELEKEIAELKGKEVDLLRFLRKNFTTARPHGEDENYWVSLSLHDNKNYSDQEALEIYNHFCEPTPPKQEAGRGIIDDYQLCKEQNEYFRMHIARLESASLTTAQKREIAEKVWDDALATAWAKGVCHDNPYPATNQTKAAYLDKHYPLTESKPKQ